MHWVVADEAKFQFQMVRLNNELLYVFNLDVVVSIPHGTIKSCETRLGQLHVHFVSIPRGSIKFAL